jgi:SPP1 family predicted phage head-tail adaptor
MDSRTLRNVVKIQQLIDGQDEIGQPVQTWVDVATVRADILHKTGSESIKADKDVSIVQASVRIRRRTDVTPAMRVVHGSTTYEIKAVLPDEQSRERLDLVCEVVNG